MELSFIPCRNLFSLNIFLSNLKIRRNRWNDFLFSLFHYQFEWLLKKGKSFKRKVLHSKKFFNDKFNKKKKKDLIFTNKLMQIFDFLFIFDNSPHIFFFQLIYITFKYSFNQIFYFFTKIKKESFEGWLSCDIFNSFFIHLFNFINKAFNFLKKCLKFQIIQNNSKIIYFTSFLKLFFWKKNDFFFFIFHKIFLRNILQKNFYGKFDNDQKVFLINSFNIFPLIFSQNKFCFFSKYIIIFYLVKEAKKLIALTIYFHLIQNLLSSNIIVLKKKINFTNISTEKFFLFAKIFKKFLNKIFFFAIKTKFCFLENIPRLFIKFFFFKISSKFAKRRHYIKDSTSIDKIFKIISNIISKNNFLFFLFNFKQEIFLRQIKKKFLNIKKINFKKIKKCIFLMFKIYLFFFPKRFSMFIFYLKYLIKLQFLKEFFMKIKKLYNNHIFCSTQNIIVFDVFIKQQISAQFLYFEEFLFLKLKNLFSINQDQILKNFCKNGNYKYNFINLNYKKIILINKKFERFSLSLFSIGNIIIILNEKIYKDLKNFCELSKNSDKNFIFFLKNYINEIFYKKLKLIFLLFEKYSKFLYQ
jgi:hypothetical protein